MKEWELTEEEIVKIILECFKDVGKGIDLHRIAEVAQKKLVEWLMSKYRHIHSSYLTGEPLGISIDIDWGEWRELRKSLGLE